MSDNVRSASNEHLTEIEAVLKDLLESGALDQRPNMEGRVIGAAGRIWRLREALGSVSHGEGEPTQEQALDVWSRFLFRADNLLHRDANVWLTHSEVEELREAYNALRAALRGDGPPERERIACGHSHPDARLNADIDAFRESEGGPPDTAGCGAAGIWPVMYRCVECARWFHRDCIRKHFAAHRGDGPPQERLERWITNDNPVGVVMRAFDKGYHGKMYSAEQLESMRVVGCPPVPNEDQRRWNGVREVLRLVGAPSLSGDGPTLDPDEIVQRSDVFPYEVTRRELEGAAEGTPLWMVIRKREIDPVEVWTGDEASMREIYDPARLNWSECYLVQVMAGPGDVLRRAALRSAPTDTAGHPVEER